jgi:hypothetical protein
VTVVESGFASLDLSDALREDAWKGNAGGWQYELAGLRIRAEQGSTFPRADSPPAAGEPAPGHPRPPYRPVQGR